MVRISISSALVTVAAWLVTAAPAPSASPLATHQVNFALFPSDHPILPLSCAQQAAKFVVNNQTYWLVQLESTNTCQSATQAMMPVKVQMLKDQPDNHFLLAMPETLEEEVRNRLISTEPVKPWHSRMVKSYDDQLHRANDVARLSFQDMSNSLNYLEHDDDGDDDNGKLDKLFHLHSIEAGIDFMLVSVAGSNLATIDTYLPPDTRFIQLDMQPWSQISTAMIQPQSKPEPRFPKAKYNSLVDTIISSSALHVERIKKDARILTGEDLQPFASWTSRHSSTYGARKAAEWIKHELEQSLNSIPGSSCSFHHYDPLFSPNVVCTIHPQNDVVGVKQEGFDQHQDDAGVVIISAHYDSRGSFGSTIAPGGDDDGSGSSALLGIARSIGNFEVQFASPVQFIAFSGEEQGLVGSKHYAKLLSDTGIQVKLVIQMDMIGYRKPGEPMQIALPHHLATQSASLYIQMLAQIYSPQLVTGFTSVCCSDHQSFWENNFVATQVFERNGPIADPMYHNSDDFTDRLGYDFHQLRSIAKVVAATLLHVAGFYL